MLRVSAHVVVYVVLGILFCLSFPLHCLWIVFLIAVADEATKPLVKGRHCSLKEMGLNVVGAVLGVVLAMMFMTSTVEAMFLQLFEAYTQVRL